MAEANIVIRLSDGRQAGQTLKELRQDANRLSREVNNLKPGTDAFVKKSKDLQQVSGRLKSVRGEISGVSKANNGLLQSFAQYVPFGGQMQNMVGGFQSLTGATNGFGLALRAIPLILIVGLIIKAVQWFASMQSVMDKLTTVTRPLTAIFERFIGLVQDAMMFLAKGFRDAIKNPEQAIKDLGNAIKENFTNRIVAIPKLFQSAFDLSGSLLSAFGAKVRVLAADIPLLGKGIDKEQAEKDFEEATTNISSGLEELGNLAIQATTGVEDGLDKISAAAQATKEWVQDGVDAGLELDRIQKEIEKTEIELTKRRAELNAEFERSKEIAQDQSRSEEERLAAAIKAQNAQNALVNLEQKFLDLKIEKKKIELDLNATSRTDELELAKLEAERTQFGAQAARKRASAKNLENTVNKQIATEEQKRQDEIQKAVEERLKKETESRRAIQDLAIEIMQEGIEKEIAQVELDTARKIEALIGSEEQIREQEKLLEIQKQQEINAIKEDYRKKDLDKEQAAQQKKYEIDQSIMDSKLEIYQMSASAAKDATDTMIALFGKESAAAKAAQAVRKVAVIAEIKATVQQQFAAANVAGAKIAALAPPVTIALGKAYTIAAKIAAVAGGAKRIAEINKLEKGGVLRGKRHYDGGIPGYIVGSGQPIEMEDGEIVLNRNVGLDPAGRAAASELNAAYGGKRFEVGGLINPLSGTNAATRQSQGSNGGINLSSTNQRLDSLISEFEMFRRDISTWANSLRVNNNLQETQQGLNTLNKLSEDAGV